MNPAIPIFNIDSLKSDNNHKDVFFFDSVIQLRNNRLNQPYRSSYYGIAICIGGKGKLEANLVDYDITKGSVIAMSPQIIKQWKYFSDDYDTIAVFFTNAFISKHFLDINYFEKFSFFDSDANHVIHFKLEEVMHLTRLFKHIEAMLKTTHPHQNEIVASYINILLFEYLSIFNQKHFQQNIHQTRSQQIAKDFKIFVNENFTKERSVKFYADLQFVTPKHLSEVIKMELGKTASDYIAEMVVLEAKVLLQNQKLTIAQIADNLAFSDQSVFGKYFKNLTLMSPLAYRQSI